jgi:hypothetical protein
MGGIAAFGFVKSPSVPIGETLEEYEHARGQHKLLKAYREYMLPFFLLRCSVLEGVFGVGRHVLAAV